jgi:hypothetical protein
MCQMRMRVSTNRGGWLIPGESGTANAATVPESPQIQALPAFAGRTGLTITGS